MFSTLALGFATVALALEARDEVEASNELIASTHAQPEVVYQPGPPPPAIDGARRRLLHVSNKYIKDLLDLNLCSNNHNAISEILTDAVRNVRNKNLRPWQVTKCSVMK